MYKEIDLLIKAAAKNCLVVEKASNVLWDVAELEEAREAGRFKEEGQVLAPDGELEVGGPFPGCLQLAGADVRYRPIGQTEHFVLFTAAPGR
jgi:hypothetical protein